MKKAANLLIIILLCLSAFSQSFEGKIVYANNYSSKNTVASDLMLSQLFGANQEYYVKDDSYKSLSNGTAIEWQLYVSADNKIYNKVPGSVNLFWIDAGENKDEVMKSEINKGVTEILGYKCDELILTCKSGIQKFYFNQGLAMDPKSFEKHVYANFNDIVAKCQAVPLKSFIDTPQFSFESTATSVTPMKLDKKFFEIPAGIKITKLEN